MYKIIGYDEIFDTLQELTDYIYESAIFDYFINDDYKFEKWINDNYTAYTIYREMCSLQGSEIIWNEYCEDMLSKFMDEEVEEIKE